MTDHWSLSSNIQGTRGLREKSPVWIIKLRGHEPRLSTNTLDCLGNVIAGKPNGYNIQVMGGVHYIHYAWSPEVNAASTQLPSPFLSWEKRGKRVVCLQHWLLGIMHSVYNALLPLYNISMQVIPYHPNLKPTLHKIGLIFFKQICLKSLVDVADSSPKFKFMTVVCSIYY